MKHVPSLEMTAHECFNSTVIIKATLQYQEKHMEVALHWA